MTDQPDEVTRYYLEERDDFFGNAPLEHLMEALSQHITARTDKRFVLGVDIGCCVGGFIEHMSGVCPKPDARLRGKSSNQLFKILEKWNLILHGASVDLSLTR